MKMNEQIAVIDREYKYLESVLPNASDEMHPNILEAMDLAKQLTQLIIHNDKISFFIQGHESKPEVSSLSNEEVEGMVKFLVNISEKIKKELK